MASFHFEVAAWTPKSSALEFIGAFDGGTKITVITKQGSGYTYDLGQGALIDAHSLSNILEMSAGRYWVNKLKNRPLVARYAEAINWDITSDHWIDDPQRELAPHLVASDWSIGGPGLFAF
jgi:hypothetical protein